MSTIPLSPTETQLWKIIQAVRNLQQGRSNATGTCTLTANAASTTVTFTTCGATSSVFLFPATAHAGAELAAGGCYVATTDIANGSFKITHANNSQTDRTFYVLCIG